MIKKLCDFWKFKTPKKKKHLFKSFRTGKEKLIETFIAELKPMTFQERYPWSRSFWKLLTALFVFWNFRSLAKKRNQKKFYNKNPRKQKIDDSDQDKKTVLLTLREMILKFGMYQTKKNLQTKLGMNVEEVSEMILKNWDNFSKKPLKNVMKSKIQTMKNFWIFFEKCCFLLMFIWKKKNDKNNNFYRSPRAVRLMARGKKDEFLFVFISSIRKSKIKSVLDYVKSTVLVKLEEAYLNFSTVMMQRFAFFTFPGPQRKEKKDSTNHIVLHSREQLV